jgi:hypothetical protein
MINEPELTDSQWREVTANIRTLCALRSQGVAE